MNQNKLSGLMIIIIVAGFIASQCFYIVTEANTAIVTQFGRFIHQETEPGLKTKTPFVQKVIFFEKRILEWDGEVNQMPTKDKKFIRIDTTARWKIVDPKQYYLRMKNIREARSKLDDILDNATRDIVAKLDLIETIRSSNREMTFSDVRNSEKGNELKISIGREEMVNRILELAKKGVSDYGVEIIDMQIKRINYNQEVAASVYNRMISERLSIAKEIRSEGAGAAQEILGTLSRDLVTIQSEGYKEATEIRGRADAKATNIYATSYSKDPEFYAFIRTLESYKTSIGNNATLILSTDNDFLQYMKKSNK